MCKRVWQPVILLACLCAGLWGAGPAWAGTFNSGSTGADGVFNPPTTVPPGTTVVGNTVTVPLPPTGIFNFTTGNVPAGLTVKFARNATNTPVSLLFSGDITIAGTLNLDASPGANGSTGVSFTANAGGVGGPGGFDGGLGSNGVITTAGGAGLGPGGGTGGLGTNCSGSGGSFGTAGASIGGACGSNGPVYGNPQVLPLLGGSGGGGGAATTTQTGPGGGGGGGALLIATSGTLTLSGTLSARGGNGGTGGAFTSGGSGAGGAVRLVATTYQAANGVIAVLGGSLGALGGQGRVRVEAFNFTGSTTTFGIFPTFATPSIGVPGVVFPTGLPSLAIASVGGVAAPAAPTGAYSTPDVTLPSTATSPVPVVVTASNVPAGTPVVLRGKPQTGAATTATTPGLAGGTAQADLALDLAQANVISAEATFQIAAVDVPIAVAQAAGPDDPVTQVRVASAFGSPAQVTYLTRSGREIQP